MSSSHGRCSVGVIATSKRSQFGVVGHRDLPWRSPSCESANSDRANVLGFYKGSVEGPARALFGPSGFCTSSSEGLGTGSRHKAK